MGLFDVAADAGERHNVEASVPGRRAALVARLREVQKDLRADGPPRWGGVRRESEAEREQLRALGYIE